MRTHDADLCDRIRRLERRVEDLEGQVAVHRHPPATYWYPYPWYPNYLPNGTYQPETFKVWSNTTAQVTASIPYTDNRSVS